MLSIRVCELFGKGWVLKNAVFKISLSAPDLNRFCAYWWSVIHPPADIGTKHSFEIRSSVSAKGFLLSDFLETFSTTISSTDHLLNASIA